MADIVLATCNARYSHTSLGLRCLLANLGHLRPRAALREFALDATPERMAAAILELQPRLLGLGVYIWNVSFLMEVARLLRARQPDLVVVLGGPELFYEADTHPLSALADYVICGEGEHAFRDLCAAVLSGQRPAAKFQTPPRVDLHTVRRPDTEYAHTDNLARRIVYVETSRGCPFACEYCLSSRDRVVRQYGLEESLAGIDTLLANGARTLKFVDRTFNLNLARAVALLTALRERATPGRVFQFEMVPDRFSPALREAVRAYPAGALRLEIGIQSFDPAVNARVGRRIDPAAIADTLAFLRAETQAAVHADLLAGLPGETLEGIGASFDRLLALGPTEIQVGLLKQLRGTPLAHIHAGWELRFSATPPYELQESRTLTADAIRRLKNVAYLWERLYNHHGFRRSLPLFWEQEPSAFRALLAWSDWMAGPDSRLHSLPLAHLVTQAFTYLTGVRTPRLDTTRVARLLVDDWAPRPHPPPMLRAHLE